MSSVGTVTKIVVPKNYGFIRYEDDEYFFHRADFIGHWNDLVSDFEMGKRINVEFLPQHTIKGPRANTVTRTDWPNQAV